MAAEQAVASDAAKLAEELELRQRHNQPVVGQLNSGRQENRRSVVFEVMVHVRKKRSPGPDLPGHVERLLEVEMRWMVGRCRTQSSTRTSSSSSRAKLSWGIRLTSVQ